ncbi:MAG: AsmA family protein [Steroidobacteraceae bacterium]
MRIVKLVAWIIGGLIALFIVAAVLVLVFVDPNDYRDDIERAVENQTGRNLELTGNLKLSVFPWISLHTGAASLGDAPGFGPEPFLAIKEAQVSVRFWPLLRGQVEAGKVRLVGARARLITDAKGRNNWDDLSKRTPTEPEAQTGPMQLPTLSGVEIVDATLIQENRQTNTRRVLSQFNLETGRISSCDPFDLKTDFLYQHSPALNVQSKVKARITADPNTQLYMLDDAAIDLTLKGPTYPSEGMPVTIAADKIQSDWKKSEHSVEKFVLTTRYKAKDAKGEGLPLELKADTLNANLRAQTLKLSDLAVRLADAQLKGNLQGEEIVDAPHLTGALQLPETSLKALFTQAGNTLPATRDPKAYERLSFEGQVDVTRTSATINKAVFKLDDTTARGSVGIADFASKALRFDLAVDRIDADRYRAPEPPKSEQKGKKESRAAEPAQPAPIPVELLRTLNLRGNLKVGEAKFAGMKFSDLQLGVNARNGQVQLQPLAAKMYEGRYQGDVTVDATGDVARIGMDQHVQGVNFAPLLKDGFDTTRLSGKGNANLKITASGRTTDALLDTLDGTLDFAVNEGTVEGADLWYEIRRARAVFKREAVPTRSGPARTTFDTLKGTGTFDNGVLSNNDLEAAMQYLRIKGQGKINLPQSTLDYGLIAQVLRIPPEGADATQMKDLVDAEIPVRVTGALSDPKVRPDIEGYIKGQAKQRIDEEKKKVEDKVRNKLQDKLKGILGGE